MLIIIPQSLNTMIAEKGMAVTAYDFSVDGGYNDNKYGCFVLSITVRWPALFNQLPSRQLIPTTNTHLNMN